MIIDCVMFAYEHDALRVRLAELEGVVDVHIVTQATTTFRGEPREIETFSDPRIISNVIVFPENVRTPWERESFQRNASVEAAQRRFAGVRDAMAVVSDTDEIPHPEVVYGATDGQLLRVDLREWYADWRAPDEWQPPHQPFIAPLWRVNSACFQRWNFTWSQKSPLTGWHLSTLGDQQLANRKLQEFAHSEYSGDEWTDTDRLLKMRSGAHDYLDRFELEHTVDLPTTMEQFPEYLGGPINR